MAVAVVTDSTADLPADLVAEHGVQIVPLRIAIDAQTAVDGVDIGPDEVVEALRARRNVSTSRPSPGDFVHAYRQALDAGADHVVSVHLSAELSGTWDSARLAAQEFGYGVVRVVDSRSTSMALGFAVMAAARAAAGGASAGDVQDTAVAAADRTSCLFYVDTLEYLRRGGRIGAAAAMLGTALSVKPLLHVRDGRIVPLEKVRTSSRALARLVALTVQAAGADPVDIGVQHLAAKDRADEVAERLRTQLPSVRQLITAEVSATVGAHTGPGVVGVAVARY
jgi:fatty acid kinase fatty acid binding subunit